MNTHDVCSPLPSGADAKGASVATTAGLSTPRSMLWQSCGGRGPLIRPYTKSELATMYFPIGSTSNALRRLNRYIHHAHGLLPALLATGYRVNDRHFTRRQVQLIFEYLGEP